MIRKRLALVAYAIFLIPACILSCSSRTGGTNGSEPIAECLQYQQALNKCMGTRLPLPVSSAPVAKSLAEIAAMKQLCVTNLQRITAACR